MQKNTGIIELVYHIREVKMKIIDMNGKDKEALSVKKIMHKVPDKINGEMLDVEFVEIQVQGKNHSWMIWEPLEEFNKNNPDFKYDQI